MKSLHAVALVLCATAPSTWIVTLVLLLVAHRGDVTRWAGDDWSLMAGVLVVPLLLAAGLLRVPPLRRPYRTTWMVNAGEPCAPIRSSHSGS